MSIAVQNKDMRKVVKKWVDQGWTLESRRHLALVSPSGKSRVFFAKTASDHRAHMNLEHELRRYQKKEQETLQ